MIKILITADNHLGKYYKKLTPERLKERRNYLRKAFEETIKFAKEEKVDLYIHAGDLFDSTNPRNADLAFVAEKFAELKEKGIDIFAVGGNHDAPSQVEGDSFPILIFEKAGLIKRVFTSQSKIEHILWEKNGERLIISGLSHDTRKRDRIDPLEKVIFSQNIPKDTLNILLLHYSFETFAHPEAKEPQVSLNSIVNLPFHIYVLGHLHKHNQYRLSDKLVIIPGSTERFEFGEIELEPGFILLLIEGRNIKMERIKINSQPMKTIEIRLTEIPELDPTNSIIERIEKVSCKNQLLKCKLIGSIPLSFYQKVNFGKIIQEGNSKNFLFDLDTQGIEVQGEKIESLPAVEWNIESILNKVSEKNIEEAPQDKEIIFEALNWIKERLREEHIL